jgi:hypothetical protein
MIVLSSLVIDLHATPLIAAILNIFSAHWLFEIIVIASQARVAEL